MAITVIAPIAKSTFSAMPPFGIVNDPKLETSHNYSLEYTETITVPGSPSFVWVTFDVQTMLWTDDTPQTPDTTFFDQLIITAPGGFSVTYTRAQAAGLTVKIPGDTFTLHVVSAFGSGVISQDQTFGFRIVDIRTTAPPDDFYQLGNRNGTDEPIIIQGNDSSSLSGYWAATHPSYEDQGVPTIMPQILPDALKGKAYSYQFLFPNGTGTLAWSIIDGNLPTGMALDATSGLLSGTSPTENEVYFTVKAFDSSTGFSTVGSFYLRVFDNPIEIDNDTTGPGTDPILVDGRSLFRFRNKIYAVYTNRTGSTRFPVIKSSVDEGKTWGVVNTGDATTLGAGQIPNAQYDDDGHVIWPFMSVIGVTADFFNVYGPVVKSYDLLANAYTTLFTSTVGTTSPEPKFRLNPVTGDMVCVGAGVLIGDTLTGNQIQVYLISANGTVATKLSTNLPSLAVSGDGLEISIEEVLVDGTGAYHVFWQVHDQVIVVPNGSSSFFYYRRVAPDGVTLGPLILLDRKWMNNENPGFAFGNGFVNNGEDELVIPFNYVPPQFGNSGPAVLRGSPLNSPVFSFELIQCSRNNDHSNFSMMDVAFMFGLPGPDGSDVLFCVGGAAWLSPGTNTNACWLLANAKDGSGWRFRDLFYDVYNVPPYGQNTVDSSAPALTIVCPLADPRGLGYSMAFNVFGPFDEPNGKSFSLMYLRYPHGPQCVVTPPPSGGPTNYIYSTIWAFLSLLVQWLMTRNFDARL